MRNLKRVLSLALALVMVLGMMVITTSAATYTDADEITYTEAVDVMSAIGVIEGYNGEFNPKGNLNRAGAAKLIAFMTMGEKADDYLTGSAATFDDVAADHWAAKYIAYCSNLKVINGNGDGTFNPDGNISTVGFGKLVLGAAGIEGEYTGANWENNVKIALEDNGLDVVTIDTTDITREEAAALMLAAMKYTATAGYTYYAFSETYDTSIECENMDQAILIAAIKGEDYKPIRVPDTSAALLTKYYNVTWNDETGVDSYGRKATVYTYDVDGTEDDWTLTYVTEKAVKTYDAETKADAIAKDLKGYKVSDHNVEGTTEATWNLSGTKYVIVDGTEMTIKVAAALTEDCTLSEALAALTDDNAVVEIYANKNKDITKIVIVETSYAVVTDAVAADAEKEIDASFKVDGKEVKKVEGFKNDDVVTYVEDATGVTKVTKLEGFAGTMTKYTSKGIYTIGDATYEISDSALVEASAIQAKQNKEMFYYLDKNGDIVNMTVVPGEEEEEVVITDYAYIVDALAKKTSVPDAWGGEPTVSYAAQVKVVLSDGTYGTYELPVVKFAQGANKGKFGYTIGKTEFVIEGLTYDGGTNLADVTALEGNVYTYTLADGAITLAAKLGQLTGSETEDTVVWVGNNKLIKKASAPVVSNTKTAAPVLINENTKFILAKDPTDLSKGLVVKTGLAALDGSTIGTWSKVIISVDYTDAKGTTPESWVNVATLVFAVNSKYKTEDAQDTENAIYIDGDYVVTKDEDNKDVYTYTAVTEDGSALDVTGAKDLDAGIYTYDTDLVIGDAASTTKYTVGVVSGTTVELKDGDVSSYITVNAKTTVVPVAEGAALATGAECYMADGIIFVTKAAK